LTGSAESIYNSTRLILQHLYPTAQGLPRYGMNGGHGSLGGGYNTRGGFGVDNGFRASPFGNRSRDMDMLEVTFALRPADVSRIIGKGGAGIKELCTSANVKLMFDKKKTTVGDPRQVSNQLALVRGKVDAVTTALTSVLMLLTDPNLGNDEKIGSHSGIETAPMTEDNTIFNMMIPIQLVGFLVGKQGARINETKSASGADVSVVNRQMAVFDANSNAQVQNMVVRGTKSCVIDAVSSLVSQLEEARLSAKARR
jgi:hypothetical protein